MCGIAGYIGPSKFDPERIESCLERMWRRGPDSAASFQHHFSQDCYVYLLHSRLSIIDLDERSNQPFRIGHKLLVCNGELYNYIELKQELLSRGIDFTTESDTEVLLKTIIEFGWEKGLDKCEGMWAFAVYGEKDGSLLLSRDRFGEKPLYLFRNSTGVYFGSEVKFIRALVGHSLDINYDHLYRYMVNGYKSLYKTKETFFEGISELQPGSILEIDDGEIVQQARIEIDSDTKIHHLRAMNTKLCIQLVVSAFSDFERFAPHYFKASAADWQVLFVYADGT